MDSNNLNVKNRIMRLLGFVLIPVAFTFLSFLIMIASVNYFFGDVSGYIDIFLLKSPPNFETQIDNIFTPSKDTGAKTIPISKVTFPEYGNIYGRIKISSISLSCPLIFGDDDDCLKKGAGQYIGSLFPGYGGTTMISGHNYYPFQNLSKVKVGDTIKIETTYGNYTYKVKKTAVKSDSDATAYDLGATYDNVILYTCIWQNTAIGNVKMRIFVYADYLSGPKIIKDN